jgi:CheY-like chemotaxis protein
MVKKRRIFRAQSPQHGFRTGLPARAELGYFFMTSSDSGLSPTTARQAAVPQRVLLVEDNLIIALDTEDTLRTLGVAHVDTAVSVQTALDLLASSNPDFAILDVSLGPENSFSIAQVLTERGTPFAFATGYGKRFAFPEPFRNTPILVKPYTEAAIRAVLCGKPAA